MRTCGYCRGEECSNISEALRHEVVDEPECEGNILNEI